MITPTRCRCLQRQRHNAAALRATTDSRQAHRPAAISTAEPGRRVLFALAGLDFRPYDFYDRRKDGNKYYGYYQQLEITLHKG